MAQRSLNKVQLIGNLTRDPELRYTPQGTAVCTFGLATNRTWVTDTGEKREEAEFHRIVAWDKLAEVCAQLLFKGRRIFAEGRLRTRQWTAQDGTPRQTTEIVINEMLILDSRQAPSELVTEEAEKKPEAPAEEAKTGDQSTQASSKADDEEKEEEEGEEKKEEKKEEGEVKVEDIPF